MECPRCESDVDGTVSYCPECGLNFDEIRQQLGLTDDGDAAAAGDGRTSGERSPATEDELARHSKNAKAAGGAGAAQGGAAQGGAAPQQQAGAGQQPRPQEDDGMLTRRRLLVGGTAVAGVGLWQTGNLEWLLGGSEDWPVPSGVERVSLDEQQKTQVRDQIGSQSAEVRVYTTTDGDPWTYYDAQSVDGWQRQDQFGTGATYRKDDRGLLVLVQQRGELIDLGLPRTSPQPTDVLLVKDDWETFS